MTRFRSRTRTAAITALAPLLAALITGCSAALSTKPSGPNAPRAFPARVNVHDDTLTLHLSSPQTPASEHTPLVLYASGDGGWFGAAVGMFRTIASRGLPTVGFSTKAFMRIEHRWSKPLRVTHIAEGYQKIIDTARTELGLARDSPVVLTGWSRGASLGVLVANSHDVDPSVVGVVAIGLAADEELDVEGDGDDGAGDEAAAPDVDAGAGHDGAIAMYPLLSRLAPRRTVVIQASGDRYLPAARARELFGSDSTMKRLVAVEAHNHRFGGGESQFDAALVEALKWVSSSGEER